MTEATEQIRQDRWFRNGWRSWVALYAAWTVPVLVVCAGFFAIGRNYGPQDPLIVVFINQLVYYWFFASLTPWVYRLEGHVSWTRRGWPFAVSTHALTVIAALCAERVLCGAVGFWTRGHTETLREALSQEFTTASGQWRGLVSIFYYVMVVAIAKIVRQNRERAEQNRRAAAWQLRLSRMETQLAEARLVQLENRLNPHFLFNALNSVASLVHRHRFDEAYRAIELLGTLLRRNLDSARPGWVPLREEFDFLEQYLAMERLRFGDRLQSRVSADPAVLDVLVPSMILQPLVENAVRHAVAAGVDTDASADAGAGRIEIRATATETGVQLAVRDNGPGLAQDWSPEDAKGLGLKLVRERLESHYDDTCGFRLENLSPHGALACLDLPLRVTA